MKHTHFPSLLRRIESIALEAGCLISEIRAAGANVDRKDDGSPVTDADRFAEDLITRELRKIDLSVPIVAEEAAYAGDFGATSERTFFLVDPLDGTKEFISGRPDFTVNICLVVNGRPHLGVVVAPARNELFSCDGNISYKCTLSEDASIRERREISTSAPSNLLAAVASASHGNAETEAFLGKLSISKKLSVGSSLKFCLVATGEADIYPRFGRTMQWDTAAGDAILRGAGGCTLTCDGEELEYGAREAESDAFENPHFVSFGGEADVLRALLRVSAQGARAPSL
jgi:3'(2'), 5'-bisphosphate nucleotidase